MNIKLYFSKISDKTILVYQNRHKHSFMQWLGLAKITPLLGEISSQKAQRVPTLGYFPLLTRRAVIVENTFAEPLSLMVTFEYL